jgi:putative DNA primase/helicase
MNTRFDDTNGEYPNHVWDTVEKRWRPKRPHAEEPLEKTGEPVLLEMEAVEMEPIEWLWKHWLAKGKFHILAGSPGTGKTTLSLSFAATISAGDYWPDKTKAKPGGVLLWTGEDDVADTIKPRLVQMGADVSRIKAIYQQREADGRIRPFNPATDMPSLAEAAQGISGGADLLIIDPIVAAIGSKTNSHNNAETRNSLQPVIDFAEVTNAAVLGITHLTKGSAGKDPTERVTGSLAFGAVARVVMLAAKSQSDDVQAPRVLTRSKSNSGEDGGGFGYDIVAAPLYERPDIIATRIAWYDSLQGSARELLAEAEAENRDDKSKQAQAERFLAAALAKGERPQREVESAARAEGISEWTLRRAAQGTTVKRKDGRTGQWFWRLT